MTSHHKCLRQRHLSYLPFGCYQVLKIRNHSISVTTLCKNDMTCELVSWGIKLSVPDEGNPLPVKAGGLN